MSAFMQMLAFSGRRRVGLPAPTFVSATKDGAVAVDLVWTNAGAFQTRIYRRTDGAFSLLATAASGVTSYRDAAVTGATTYQYYVAHNTTLSGDGVASATLEATTDVTPPSFDRGITSIFVATNQIHQAFSVLNMPSPYTVNVSIVEQVNGSTVNTQTQTGVSSPVVYTTVFDITNPSPGIAATFMTFSLIRTSDSAVVATAMFPNYYS